MKASDPQFPFVWDLGETWHQWTGKPFVFAVWAARPDSDLDRLSHVLSSARDRGLDELATIASDQAALYDLSDEECLKYLQDYLHFKLGVNEKSGMELYFQFAADLSLIPKPIQLQFHDCQTTG
jgi:chorismate dehydratase